MNLVAATGGLATAAHFAAARSAAAVASLLAGSLGFPLGQQTALLLGLAAAATHVAAAGGSATSVATAGRSGAAAGVAAIATAGRSGSAAGVAVATARRSCTAAHVATTASFASALASFLRGAIRLHSCEQTALFGLAAAGIATHVATTAGRTTHVTSTARSGITTAAQVKRLRVACHEQQAQKFGFSLGSSYNQGLALKRKKKTVSDIGW